MDRDGRRHAGRVCQKWKLIDSIFNELKYLRQFRRDQMRRNEASERARKAEEAQKLKVTGFSVRADLMLLTCFPCNRAFENKNFATAEQMYAKALDSDSADPKIWNNIAIARMELGKYEEALADAKQAIQIDEAYLNGYLRAVEALMFLHRLEVINEQLQLIQEAQQYLAKAQQLKVGSKDVAHLKASLKLVHDNRHKMQIEAMLDWLRSNGALFPKITVQMQSENSRSVICKQKINRKDTVLFIPRNLMITLELALQSKTVQLLEPRRSQLLSPKHCLLSIYLLQQKHTADSPFKLYLDILPKHHPHFPFYYTESQLNELKGSHFCQQIQQKRSEIKKDYQTIRTIDVDFSYEEFCWARMTVCSRVFGINIHESKTDALVPLADMLNHRVPRQTAWSYCDVGEGFLIEAMEGVGVGEEVFDSYGRKCNSRFLLNYGFILNNNESNQVTIKVELSENDPFLARKIDLIHDDTMVYLFRVSKNHDDKAFEQLLAGVRFATLQYSFCQLNQHIMWIMNHAQKPYKITHTPFLTYQHQGRAWNHLKNILDKQLSEYLTTLAQDQKLLNQKLSVNVRNCVLLRKGEKEILHSYLKMSQKMARLFELRKKEFKKAAQKQEYKEYAGYLERIVSAIQSVG